MKQPIRILIAKPGLDGHTRGALVIARGLMEAGMHVLYSGLRKTPEQIVEMAVRNRVDLVGLSSLSGAHMSWFPEVMRLLRQKRPDMPVICGGIIPEEDIPKLREMGISAIFPPGTEIRTVVSFIRENIGKDAPSQIRISG
ncbi:cobalamin B12-binding domain-containing protein [Ferviditalea candida]|uniref:Cobalamin B12-binding domain-containing protein n=1 Tax=Ferviditalea candida TaxID=3108399 RepID=A0ABU5ZG71_9BACL|nr:cobalamin B12-binding domain-containing protein [Paenibacillaceae bacterium T2]